MERPKILVLGAGLVGGEIARCLSEVSSVTVVDRDKKALAAVRAGDRQGSELDRICADFFDTVRILDLAGHHDVVVGAIEPSIAYRVLVEVAKAGTPIVDISFYEEHPLLLDEVAERCGIPISVDCGVMPGLGGMLLGYESTKMRVRSFLCQCGGLPVEPKAPWFHKALFSPQSVEDLYMRKAVIVASGKRVEVDPMETVTEVCLPEYPQLGTLTGIYSDGLRTLLDTTDVPDMADQTLRYPDHIHIVKNLIKSGSLSEMISSDALKLGKDEDEFTVFVVRIKGVPKGSGGKERHVTYHTLVRRDPVTHTTSMSRITGYPCAAVALLLARGEITESCVITPEEIGGNEKLMQFVRDFMEERGISLTRTVSNK